MTKSKKLKHEVDYQWSPRANGERCATCTMFRAPRSCTDVEGVISSHGWCKLWFAKPGKLAPFAKD